MQSDRHPLEGWIPYKLSIQGDVPFVHWLYTKGQSFDDPFFDESIARCQSHPYNSSHYKCTSSIESMIDWAASLPEIIPAAFVFHVSRCGSTLLSQLIGADEKYVTLAEVPFFDELLRLQYKLNFADEDFRKKALSAALKFVAAKRGGGEQHVFIKTDSWHIFYYEIYRELFPSTPCVLLYRLPDEVIRSHQKLRGIHAVPGFIEPELFSFGKNEIENYHLDEYTAHVLAKYFSAFAAVYDKDPCTLLLDYKQGVMPMITAIEKHLGISWTEDHLLKMKERSGYHSKRPEQPFSEEMQKTEIPEYQKNAMLLYDVLDKKRIEQEHRLPVRQIF